MWSLAPRRLRNHFVTITIFLMMTQPCRPQLSGGDVCLVVFAVVNQVTTEHVAECLGKSSPQLYQGNVDTELYRLARSFSPVVSHPEAGA